MMGIELGDFTEGQSLKEPVSIEQERNRTTEAKMILGAAASASATAFLGLAGEHESAAVFATATVAFLSGGLYLRHKDLKEINQIENETAQAKLIQFPPQKL